MRRAFLPGLMVILCAPFCVAQTTKKVVITNLGPAYSRIGDKELAEFGLRRPTSILSLRKTSSK